MAVIIGDAPRVMLVLARISARAVALCFAFLTALAPKGLSAEEARIAVAANFKSVLEQLKGEFEAHSSHRLSITSGSTGKLYAQIVNGAPFDVFLAADQDRPIRLETEGSAVSGSRITYAVGELALWSPSGEAPPSAMRLRNAPPRAIALAHPDLAPYGAAAQETLAALGFTDEETPKRVYGESVGQAFAFVRSGAAELGFVAHAQILSLPAEERGAAWIVPAELHAPIRQDAVLLKRAVDNAAALDFMTFLNTEAAASLITAAGYAPNAAVSRSASEQAM